jgi:hypothetical protein
MTITYLLFDAVDKKLLAQFLWNYNVKHNETTHSVKVGIQTTATPGCSGFRHVCDDFALRFRSRLWRGDVRISTFQVVFHNKYF